MGEGIIRASLISNSKSAAEITYYLNLQNVDVFYESPNGYYVAIIGGIEYGIDERDRELVQFIITDGTNPTP